MVNLFMIILTLEEKIAIHYFRVMKDYKIKIIA